MPTKENTSAATLPLERYTASPGRTKSCAVTQREAVTARGRARAPERRMEAAEGEADRPDTAQDGHGLW